MSQMFQMKIQQIIRVFLKISIFNVEYENVTLDKELTSMSQYQTVPRRLEMLNSNDTTVFRSSENMKENHIIFSAEKWDNSLINSKSSYSGI